LEESAFERNVIRSLAFALSKSLEPSWSQESLEPRVQQDTSITVEICNGARSIIIAIAWFSTGTAIAGGILIALFLH
jgi:hypothetical protein